MLPTADETSLPGRPAPVSEGQISSPHAGRASPGGGSFVCSPRHNTPPRKSRFLWKSLSSAWRPIPGCGSHVVCRSLHKQVVTAWLCGCSPNELFSLSKSVPVISLHRNLSRAAEPVVKMHSACTSSVGCQSHAPLPSRMTSAARCTFPRTGCRGNCPGTRHTSLRLPPAGAGAFDSNFRQPFHPRTHLGANRDANVIL